MIKFLPPIILVFGGIIPLLLSAVRIGHGRGMRRLLSIILVLIVWVGYWIPVFVSNLWWYSNVITLLTLFGGVLALIFVFIRSQSVLALYVYFIGLLLISVAATNYVGVSGDVALDFKADQPISETR